MIQSVMTFLCEDSETDAEKPEESPCEVDLDRVASCL